MPKISATEQTALDAGDLSVEAELFRGRPNFNQLQAIPKPCLSTVEQQFIDCQLEKLCMLLDDWQIIQERDLPRHIWDYLKQEKFFALNIPKKYGGLEFSALANSSIVEKISSRSISAAVTVMVPNSLGPAELLLEYGTVQQRDYYLPRLASSVEIPCFALTSSVAGSDATAITDSGVICKGDYNGEEIIGIKLNFNKRYITLAPVATLLGLAVKLFDPEQLLGEQKELGISLCLVATNNKKITIRRHLPLNQAFMNGSVRGQDIFVPLTSVIGGEKMIGKGWRMLVECLSIGRGISLPALSSGVSKLSYLSTSAYARTRTQFKLPIGKFDAVAAGLAHIAGYNYMINAVKLLTLSIIDLGKKPAIITAITKYHTTEMARKSLNIAMDIHGGKAIMTGPNNYLANAYVSIPIAITVEGANILTRSLMIFGQGAIRCHPYILEEIKVKSKDDFNKVIYKHIFYIIINLAKLKLYALVPKNNHQRQIKHMSLALSNVAECALLLLGGKLKRLELLSARLGDVLSYLYISVAVLKYYNDNKNNTDCAEIDYLNWSINSCLYNAQQALVEFWDNFPNKIIARIMRIIVFPWGLLYKKPTDHLGKKISTHMMQDSNLRDRLAQGCYIGNKDSVLSKLQQGLAEAIQVDDFD